MARPKKTSDESLSHIIPTFRMTEKDGQTLRARAKQAGLKLPEYIRQMLITGEVIVQEAPVVDFSIVYELKKIGTNLNQIARVANTTERIKKTLEANIAKLDGILDQVIENY